MTTIAVVDRNLYGIYETPVQVSVTFDGFFEYCSHAHQTIQYVTTNDGLYNEYGTHLSVCDKCGAGWDETGEQLIEARVQDEEFDKSY